MRNTRIKIVGILFAVLSMLGGAALMAGPASADQIKSSCQTFSRGALSDAYVCVEIYWHQQTDGSGIVVTEADASIQNASAFNDPLAVDGFSISIQNGNNYNYLWSSTACNIWKPDNVHVFTFGGSPIRMPSNQAVFNYSYEPKLNNWPDPSPAPQFNFRFGVGIVGSMNHSHVHSS